MSTFAGRWHTTFGPMELHESTRNKVQGIYSFQGDPCSIEGIVEGDRFVFRYQESIEGGEGWFEQGCFGQFRGQYRPDGADEWRDWAGHREWDGIWETSYGRMRLIQEADRIHGFYGSGGGNRIDGRLDGTRFVFSYQEPNVAGEGWFELAGDAGGFAGAWRPAGDGPWGNWSGQRIRARPGLIWLVVIEAAWQHSLADPEYSYGVMLREFFARLPHVAVRHRFFTDEASLKRWCRELLYCPEPAIVLISSHGTTDGVAVNGQTVNINLVIDSLRDASDIKLLHFATCLVLKEDKTGDLARRIEKEVPFPISGYTTSIDWGGSACVEFTYLDMILSKGLAPEDAAARLPALVGYAGDHAPTESPYAAVGFRFFRPGSLLKPANTASDL